MTVTASVAADVRLEGLTGKQTPRWRLVPPRVDTYGPDAVAFCADVAGLNLDPWQRLVLDDMLAVDVDDRWAAFECGLIVPRQNGKSALIEARILAGMFLLEEELIVYTAHEARTAVEVMRRVESLVMGAAQLRAEVRGDRFKWSHGSEGFELKSGQRCLFKTRTGSSGRGFSGDVVFLDEAMRGLGEEQMAALMSTMSARDNPQLIYAGSAGDEESVILGRIVRRIRKGDANLAGWDWCVDETNYDRDDPRSVAEANPGLGIRLNPVVIRSEMRTLGHEQFDRERLGVGTYPRDDDEDRLIPSSLWTELELGGDGKQRAPVDPVSFGIAVRPDRSKAAIGVVWRDGSEDVVDVVAHEDGVRWLPGRVRQLREKWGPVAVVADEGGPTGSLRDDFEAEDVEINWVGLPEYADATAGVYDEMVKPGEFRIRHRGHPGLNGATAGVEERTVGDRWVWKRRGTTDITPLEAITLAWHGLHSHLVALGSSGLWGFVD